MKNKFAYVYCAAGRIFKQILTFLEDFQAILSNISMYILLFSVILVIKMEKIT